MEEAALYLLKTGFKLHDPKFVKRFLDREERNSSLSNQEYSEILKRILADIDETLRLYDWLVNQYDPSLAGDHLYSSKKVIVDH